MGADYIGFRSCGLQRSLGPEGFLGKLKLRAYKGAIEAQVPPEQRATVKIQVQVTNRPPRALDYATICAELETFLAGSPECASCPLAGGNPVGCYRYVGYPIDAIAEELVFSFFCRDLDTPDSIADQLYRDIVSRVPQGSGWHTQRPRPLAELPAPLVHVTPRGRRVDSAQVLAGLFASLEHPAMLVGYARFFGELLQHVAEERAKVAVMGPDGKVQVKVELRPGEDPTAATQRALERARAIYGSRTVAELADVAELLHQAIPYAMNGQGSVLVDS